MLHNVLYYSVFFLMHGLEGKIIVDIILNNLKLKNYLNQLKKITYMKLICKNTHSLSDSPYKR